jgi:hypothetical protein
MQPGQRMAPGPGYQPPQQAGNPFAQAMGAPQGPPQGAPMQGPPMQAGGGDMVNMVGPDGTQKAIPRANVQEAIRRGARMA